MDHRYTWTETFSCFGSPWTISYRYTFESDSSEFNGFYYYQLLESEEPAGDNFEPTGKYIRNDDSNHVFIYENGFERVLYDFSLSIGDTFDTKNDYECKLIVGAIDSFELNNGEIRKKWIMYTAGDEFMPQYIDGYPFWIEGIGNNYGLLGNDQMCQIDGCGSGLLCVHFLDTLIFQVIDSCWLLISNAKDFNFHSIEIQPNPASNFIQISDLDQKVVNVSVINLYGNLIKLEFEQPIDVTSLASGPYFLCVELKNGQKIYKKFIKI